LILVFCILYADASPAGNITEAKDIADCSIALCGQACFIFFTATYCNIVPNSPISHWTTYALGDTSGVITPFNSTQLGAVPPILSLLKVIPGENQTTSCPYMQYIFYDANNYTVGSTYITPGQTHSPCISFDREVTAYSCATMLTTVLEELLEWAEDCGNVRDGGLQLT
jgi:hypothetical protein